MSPLASQSSSADTSTNSSSTPRASAALAGPWRVVLQAQYHLALPNSAAQSRSLHSSLTSLCAKSKQKTKTKELHHVSESDDFCMLPEYRTRGSSFYCLENALPFYFPVCRIPSFSSCGLSILPTGILTLMALPGSFLFGKRNSRLSERLLGVWQSTGALIRSPAFLSLILPLSASLPQPVSSSFWGEVLTSLEAAWIHVLTV